MTPPPWRSKLAAGTTVVGALLWVVWVVQLLVFASGKPVTPASLAVPTGGTLLLILALPWAASRAASPVLNIPWLRGGQVLTVVGLLLMLLYGLGLADPLSQLVPAMASTLDHRDSLVRLMVLSLSAGILALTATWNRSAVDGPLRLALALVGGFGLVWSLFLNFPFNGLTTLAIWLVGLVMLFAWIGVAAWSATAKADAGQGVTSIAALGP